VIYSSVPVGNVAVVVTLTPVGKLIVLVSFKKSPAAEYAPDTVAYPYIKTLPVLPEFMSWIATPIISLWPGSDPGMLALTVPLE